MDGKTNSGKKIIQKRKFKKQIEKLDGKECMVQKYFFKVPQKALIRKGNKFLIVKRSPAEPVYPNTWDFPGGKLEKGELPEKGLKREVLEETGLKVNVGKPLLIFTEVLAHYPTLFIVYQCKMMSGKIKLSFEHTEWKWATKKDLKKLKIENYMKAFFKKSI